MNSDDEDSAPARRAAAPGAPPLSVVMPVRDLAPFVGAAIESILAQTHRDFEFVILDDGSTDGTRDIVRRWRDRDPRIRLIEREAGLGPAESSNLVVREARGAILARMDGDDISHPDRLRLQLEALRSHPEAVLVGSLCEGIDGAGRVVRPRDRSRLVARSPFAPFPHGSIMFRREAFERIGGYRREANFWEDLDLYRRLSHIGGLLVLPAALYRHRASPLSTRLTSRRREVERSVDRMYRQVVAGEAPRPDGRLAPYVFVSLGSTLLWAGRRPRVFLPLLRRAALRPDASTLAALVWGMWGAVSPASLRLVLRAGVWLRDLRAAARVPEEGVYAWVPADGRARPVRAAQPSALPHPASLL